MIVDLCVQCIFFFNDTATTEIYTLSLHDALPISAARAAQVAAYRLVRRHGIPRTLPRRRCRGNGCTGSLLGAWHPDRKSTRLNSSHANISYAVFCLKKKRSSRAEGTGTNRIARKL